MPYTPNASCEAISQWLTVESGRIGPEAYERGRETEPIWLGLIEQKPWHDEMGYVISNTIYERAGLTTPPVWSNMQGSNGVSGSLACIPPVTEVDSATTLQQYQRAWLALESAPLCLYDLVVAHEPVRAIQAFVDNLTSNATYVRKERIRSEYERLCYNKVVITAGLPSDTAGFPLVQPTSPVTLGVLRQFYRQLQRESNGTTNVTRLAQNSRGAEQFIFVSSGETIENAVKGDGNIRDDFRWSSRVDELLGAFDNKFCYGGFVMWEDAFPPRYNWGGADFVRVPEYVATSATIGQALEINPAWNNAQFEVSYIFHPNVMCSRVPDPKQSFGDVKYMAQNYTLEFRWVNEWMADCNPDRTIGWFRGIGIHASEPIFGQFGWAMMGLKCNVALDLMPCAANSGYNSSGNYSGGYSPDA